MKRRLKVYLAEGKAHAKSLRQDGKKLETSKASFVDAVCERQNHPRGNWSSPIMASPTSHRRDCELYTSVTGSHEKV